LDDLEYLGKTIGKTKKGIAQERLLKKLCHASLEASRSHGSRVITQSIHFEASIKAHHRRTATAPEDKLKNPPFTWERFEE
jgi:hypothetical protein